MNIKKLKWALIGVAIGLAVGCSTVGKTVSIIGSAVYTVASKAVTDYCSLTTDQRAVLQLVIAGKSYNSGVCDVVNGDTTLEAKLATATQEEAAELIGNAVTQAVSDGKITQDQANVILGVTTAVTEEVNSSVSTGA